MNRTGMEIQSSLETIYPTEQHNTMMQSAMLSVLQSVAFPLYGTHKLYGLKHDSVLPHFETSQMPVKNRTTHCPGSSMFPVLI